LTIQHGFANDVFISYTREDDRDDPQARQWSNRVVAGAALVAVELAETTAELDMLLAREAGPRSLRVADHVGAR